jgi:hypothetical protein
MRSADCLNSSARSSRILATSRRFQIDQSLTSSRNSESIRYISPTAASLGPPPSKAILLPLRLPEQGRTTAVQTDRNQTKLTHMKTLLMVSALWLLSGKLFT